MKSVPEPVDTSPVQHPARRRSVDTLGIVAVLLVILLVAYISASDGIDYVHGFGKACLVFHGSVPEVLRNPGWRSRSDSPGWSCGRVPGDGRWPR